MPTAVLRRLLLFLPTLLAVSALAFALSRLTPGDPVLHFLVSNPFETAISSPDALRRAEQAYLTAARRLHADKPAFYFGISARAFPDTLHRILPLDRRLVLEQLTAQFGNWPAISDYHQALRQLERHTLSLPDSLHRFAANFRLPLLDLYTARDPATIRHRLDHALPEALQLAPPLQAFLEQPLRNLQDSYRFVETHPDPAALRTPSFRWYGADNQYHHWLSDFLRGDFGTSRYDRRPVADKVAPALFWTLTLNIASLLLASLLAIPIGIGSAIHRRKRFDRIATIGLFLLYSLPVFWIGTLLLVFFTTRTYGMDFFPGPGLGYLPSTAGPLEKILRAAPHLVLPVVCLTYPSLAFISRQVRNSMSEVLRQDYIRLARAKGLPRWRIYGRHAFRNALFPLITILGAILPGLVAGSVTIEFLFNIPGMGWLTYQGIFTKDWPVVFTVLMLGAVLTMAGVLLADILYTLADPRIRRFS
ncbi:MAG: hypothetical protein RLY31_2224 [Bacteroidota bacterium]|jgi:peptide/nickel transport system permease protein